MEQQNNQNFNGDTFGVAGNVEGDQVTNVFPPASRPKPTGIPNNLPGAASSVFVGREEALKELEQKLQQDKRVAIAAIAGMGGIGKTALALEYAYRHLEDYPGGVCWLRVRGQELTSQIVGFAQAELGLQTPERLEGEHLVRWCWSHWKEGQVLLIFDDVAGQETIKPYLPPLDDRFRVVATTRERWRGMQRLDLDVLGEDAALDLLRQLVGMERVDEQIEDAHQLCARLGYLPLALELVGGFLGEEEFWSLRRMLDELEELGLTQEALVEADGFMTAQRGVQAAFELSWVRLPDFAEGAQEIAKLLGGFAASPVPWLGIKEIAQDMINSERVPLEKSLRALKRLNLVKENAGRVLDWISGERILVLEHVTQELC
ncbi:MAG: NB-ARC domain-containing protein, partial [Cyanobacteria bacterium J06642_12]